MLYLLFISDNLKSDQIKDALQPLIRVNISVVADFDSALTDIFEKRPAVVCIQDQIAGITGESVARNVQMLLGTDAPAFILIHDGSGKARQINGLFDYVVDLSQPAEMLVEEIKFTLKFLIGDQWDTKQTSPKQLSFSMNNLFDLPDELSGDVDKLAAMPVSPLVLPDIPLEPVRSGLDLSELKADVTTTCENVAEYTVPVDPDAGTPRTILAHVGDFPPVTPADFFIGHKETHTGMSSQKRTTPAFEEKNRLKSRMTKRSFQICISVLLLLAMACGWYFMNGNSTKSTSITRKSGPVSKSTPTANPPKPVAQPAPIAQKADQPIAAKPTLPPPFPTFIPRDHHDKSYAEKNPGWERYTGAQFEFRLFSAGNKPRALQILATKDNVIPDAFVKTVLNEFVGGSDYQISSREIKSGIQVLRGSVAQKADLIFYNKESAVRAFVVSLR